MKHIKMKKHKNANVVQTGVGFKTKREVLIKQRQLKSLKGKLHWEGNLDKIRTNHSYIN